MVKKCVKRISLKKFENNKKDSIDLKDVKWQSTA